jgi:hypothetical protein
MTKTTDLNDCSSHLNFPSKLIRGNAEWYDSFGHIKNRIISHAIQLKQSDQFFHCRYHIFTRCIFITLNNKYTIPAGLFHLGFFRLFVFHSTEDFIAAVNVTIFSPGNLFCLLTSKWDKFFRSISPFIIRKVAEWTPTCL